MVRRVCFVGREFRDSHWVIGSILEPQ